MGISPSSPIQQDLFDVNAEQIAKYKRLDKVIDRINKCYGSETIVIGSQQYTQMDDKAAIQREQSQACLNSAKREQTRPKVKADVFANAIKHDFKSKNPTTRWSDIIKLK
jgi:DNA polymerase V